MRLLACLTLAASLTGAALLGVGSAHAAATVGAVAHRVPSPVVIEWFSRTAPKTGQKETVYVRVLDHNKPLKGAALVAKLQMGKSVLSTLKGGTTDSAGKAQASFTVPSAAHGKSLRVAVTLKYGKYIFTGRNDLKVK